MHPGWLCPVVINLGPAFVMYMGSHTRPNSRWVYPHEPILLQTEMPMTTGHSSSAKQAECSQKLTQNLWQFFALQQATNLRILNIS
jgi:hypothetical protein